MGTSFLLALLGGFLADTFFTTYHIFLISAAIEFLVIAVCALSLPVSLSLFWVGMGLFETYLLV
jgi:dipeptide/tripeptide permease